jgi:hypothetical protein
MEPYRTQAKSATEELHPERHVVRLLVAMEGGEPTRAQITATLDALAELNWSRFALVRLEAAHRLRLRPIVLDGCWIELRRKRLREGRP